MPENDDSPFLTIDETAELLRIKRRTLDNLRWSGDGPPARRHGGRVVYHRREVLDWSERRRARRAPSGGTGKAPQRRDNDARHRHSRDAGAPHVAPMSAVEHKS